MKRQHAQHAGGFTLIEVLVALAIVSVALMSGLKVSGALTRNAQRQADVMLAQICADNALNQLRLSQQLPGVGDSRVPCPQVERNFEVALTVRGTPNPASQGALPDAIRLQIDLPASTGVRGRLTLDWVRPNFSNTKS